LDKRRSADRNAQVEGSMSRVRSLTTWKTTSTPSSASLSRVVSMEPHGGCKLRGIRVNEVLKFPGCLLRNSVGNVFGRSEDVEMLGAFLSHSWRASAFSKQLTLLIHYRWKAAVLAAFAAALLAPIACPMQSAPVILVYIALSMGCGLTAMLIAILAWPSQSMVFLDTRDKKTARNPGAARPRHELTVWRMQETLRIYLWAQFGAGFWEESLDLSGQSLHRAG